MNASSSPRFVLFLLPLLTLLSLPLFACDLPSLEVKPSPGETGGAPAGWVKHPGNPVFTTSPPGRWDSDWVTCFSVRKLGSTFWMYYSGRRDSAHPLQIGVATSLDGINWTRYPDSILAPGQRNAWDNKTIYGPDVAFHQGQYKMWYVGQSTIGGCGIGYATSPDGYLWAKQGSAPVISGAGCLSVDVDGDSLVMLYMGSNGFCRASSYDGANWVQFSGNPVFLPGDTTEWDEIIASPSLVILGGEYHLLYTGADTVGNSRGDIQIGYASSSDRGWTWTRDPANPMIRPSQPWEGKCLYSNNAVMSPTLYQMWYASAGFGYADNDLSGAEEKMEDRNQRLEVNIKPIPNPFVSFATIPGLEFERFALYDISGRLVGTHRGDRIGGNLPPGVYFLRGHNQNSTPIRIVKVR